MLYRIWQIYALQLIHAQGFDLVVLDLGLPDMDGLKVLRSLRKQKIALPILNLTARDGSADRIEGISQRADDYLASFIYQFTLCQECNSFSYCYL